MPTLLLRLGNAPAEVGEAEDVLGDGVAEDRVHHEGDVVLLVVLRACIEKRSQSMRSRWSCFCSKNGWW